MSDRSRALFQRAQPLSFATIAEPGTKVAPPPWMKGNEVPVRRFVPKGGVDIPEDEAEPQEDAVPAWSTPPPAEPPRAASLPPAPRLPSVPPAPPGPPPPPPPPPGPDPEVVAAKRALAEAALELATVRAREVARLEESVASLAVELAEAILEDEIERRPELHRALAKAALDALGANVPAKLRAGRKTYDAILETFGGPRVEIEGVRVDVQLDTALDGLGCVAEAGELRADGRLKVRLESVRRAMARAATVTEES